MHVAQFVHRYPPALGGAEAYAARLSRHLTAAGDRVVIWTTTANDLSAFTRRGYREFPAGTDMVDGAAVRRYPPRFRFPARRYVFKALSLIPVRPWQAMVVPWTPTLPDMWRDAGRGVGNPDAVHGIAFPYGSIVCCALRLARRCRVPFVLTPFLHLGDPDDPRDRIRRAYTSPHLQWLLRQADRVLVQTPTEGEAVCETGISSDRVILQGLGVDPADCTGGNRDTARRSWGIGPGEVVVGHLANQSPEKGTVDLLRAAAEVRRAGLPLRVVLAGPSMPAFTEFWKGFGPAPWVTQLGAISDEGRRDFYAGLDAFAMPSRSDSFGLVFLEAWANDVPVIGYRAGGVADVIRHGEDGLLVKCGDLDGLAAAIKRMVSDEAERTAWGRSGRERLGRDFRWEDKLEVARRALTMW